MSSDALVPEDRDDPIAPAPADSLSMDEVRKHPWLRPGDPGFADDVQDANDVADDAANVGATEPAVAGAGAIASLDELSGSALTLPPSAPVTTTPSASVTTTPSASVTTTPSAPVALTPSAPVTPRDVAESATRAVVEIEQAIAGLQAMRAHLLAGIGRIAIEEAHQERIDPGIGIRDAACEIALLTRRHDRTVEADIDRAMAESAAWPAPVRAWGDAKIHRGHVAVIAEIGAPLQDAAARAAFEQALLEHAETTAPGRLRAIARRELDRHLERPFEERHRAARDRRGVFQRDLDDGMSAVTVIVPTVLATGFHDRLTRQARALLDAWAAEAKAGAREIGPRPTLDQLRADLLCDLLLTGEPSDAAIAGIQATVSVILPPEVLLGAAVPEQATEAGPGTGRRAGPGTPPGAEDHTERQSTTREPDGGGGAADHRPRFGEAAVARLAGGQPVDPETARLLAERATSWVRLFTDPIGGHVVAVDTYTPSDRLKRLLRARDQHCRWPGCDQRAARCDIDHTRPWAEGGKTHVGNLAHLCRRHHTLKGARLSGARRWKVRQSSPGVLEFTSPMGQTYIDEPPRVGPVFRDGAAADAWAASGSADRGELPF